MKTFLKVLIVIGGSMLAFGLLGMLAMTFAASPAEGFLCA